MTEVKWIKIATDIFNDEKMLLIDGLSGHDAIIVIWFKLLCLAGKQNNGGVFMIGDKMAFTDEMLATIFHRPLNTVRHALDIFEKYGMIKIVDDTITIPNWSKHQSLDSYEKRKESDRVRQAKKRESERAVIAESSADCHVMCRTMSRDMSRDVTHTESDKNKNKNKNRESEIEEIEEAEEDNTSLSASQTECPYSQIRDLYHQICISYPAIKAIDGNRKKAVAARWRTYRSLDTFENLFRLAEASPFLKGENERNWFADFDWMMKPTNFTKILERKYEGQRSNEFKTTNNVFDTLQRMHEEARRDDEAGNG